MTGTVMGTLCVFVFGAAAILYFSLPSRGGRTDEEWLALAVQCVQESGGVAKQVDRVRWKPVNVNTAFAELADAQFVLGYEGLTLVEGRVVYLVHSPGAPTREDIARRLPPGFRLLGNVDPRWWVFKDS